MVSHSRLTKDGSEFFHTTKDTKLIQSLHPICLTFCRGNYLLIALCGEPLKQFPKGVNSPGSSSRLRVDCFILVYQIFDVETLLRCSSCDGHCTLNHLSVQCGISALEKQCRLSLYYSLFSRFRMRSHSKLVLDSP